jgi:photosystem II stability/assembly factor-like uncharacterized protein
MLSLLVISALAMRRPDIGISTETAWRFNWLRAGVIVTTTTAGAVVGVLFLIALRRYRRPPGGRPSTFTSTVMTVALLAIGGGGVASAAIVLRADAEGSVATLMGHVVAGLSALGIAALAGWTLTRRHLRPTFGVGLLSVGLIGAVVGPAAAIWHDTAPTAGYDPTSWVAVSSYWEQRLIAEPDATASYPAVSCSGLDCLAVGSGLDPSVVAAASSDGGATWSPVSRVIQPGVPYYSIPLSLACSTPHACLATGDALITTNGGGRNWTTSSLSARLASRTVACPSPQLCIVAGNLLGAQGSTSAHAVRAGAYVTSDGGLTWTAARLPGGAWNVGRITCPTETSCFMSAQTSSKTPSPAVMVSSDAGMTWAALPVPDGVLPNQISCATSTDCVALGVQGMTGLADAAAVGEVDALSTTDGGRTWSIATVAHANVLTAGPPIVCTSPGDCLAAFSQESGTAVYRTTDNGVTWRQTALVPAFGGTLLGLFCAGSQHCFLAGGQPLPSGLQGASRGAIYAGDATGQSWTVVHIASHAVPAG